MRLARADVPPIYALTPNRQATDLGNCVAALARGGARWIQIREKWMPDRILVRSVVGIVDAFPDVRIIVNDRIDIAFGTGAFGVHLGDRDLPPDTVPEITGDRPLITGGSTHSVEEAIRMSRSEFVDYVALGPIFSSRTKMVRDALGPSAIEEARRMIEKPIVAIGGIDGSNIEDVFRAGADSAAVIAALYDEGTIEDNVRTLIDRAALARGR